MIVMPIEQVAQKWLGRSMLAYLQGEATQLRPMLDAVIEQGRAVGTDGFVRFYLRATINDRTDQDAIIRMPLHEVCDFFERKFRATKGLKNFAVNGVAILSCKADRNC